MEEKFNLIILGPQGSGKGTQARLIAQKFDMIDLDTGQIARGASIESTPLGKKIKECLKKGQLLPQEIIKELLYKKVSEIKNNGIIFDGFPRDFRQVDTLESFVKEFKLNYPYLIHLKVTEKTTISRISSRRICPKCKNVYYPKSSGYDEGICLKCNETLITRDDDQPNILKERLKIYHQETEKIIDYFKNKNHLIEINGEPDVPEVFKEILAKIKSLN